MDRLITTASIVKYMVLLDLHDSCWSSTRISTPRILCAFSGICPDICIFTKTELEVQVRRNLLAPGGHCCVRVNLHALSRRVQEQPSLLHVAHLKAVQRFDEHGSSQ